MSSPSLHFQTRPARGKLPVICGILGLAGITAAIIIVNLPSPKKSRPLGELETTEKKTQTEETSEWTDLLANDLAAWNTWLGVPYLKDGHLIPLDLPDNEKPQALGLNNDPNNVFSVSAIDGKTTLKVTGYDAGALTSKKSYRNYHLSAKYKWGEKSYPFYHGRRFDSGILIHCFGPQGGSFGYWMKCIEFQIRDDAKSGNVVFLDTKAWSKARRLPNVKEDAFLQWVYDRSENATERSFQQTVIQRQDGTKETEGWNQVEILSFEDNLVFKLNGHVTSVFTKVSKRFGGEDDSLTEGKIQIQSRAAEIFFQEFKIRSISSPPKELQDILEDNSFSSQ